MTTHGTISAAGWRGRYATVRSRTERLLIALALLGVGLMALPILSLFYLATGGVSALSQVYLTIVLPRAAFDTLLLLAGVGVLTAAIGVGAAWLVSAFVFPGRKLFGALLAMPLAIPTYIAAYSWVELLEPLGPVQRLLRAVFGFQSAADYWFPPVRSLGGAVVIFSLVLFPYVYLTVRAVFLVQSASLVEAARTLGRGPASILASVGLPLARPAIAAGMALALLETLNDIGASEYLGVRTLTVTVMQTWLNRNSLPGAALIACVMLVIVTGVILAERRMRRDRRYALSVQKPRLVTPIRLEGWRAALASLACALPVLVAFVIPALFLAHEAIAIVLNNGVDAGFLRQLTTTLALSAVATIVIVALGAAIVLAQRIVPARRTLMAMRVGALGYALPGTVLAVGLLWPLARFDDVVAQASLWAFGVSPGLILSGSGAAIVIAYTIRFLAISIANVESGIARYSPHIDHAARALGRGPAALLREIHLPLIRPALASAGLLVFIDCVKELPATLILRPLNVDTLATALYEHAARGSFETGAPQALAIVIAGLIPVLHLARKGLAADLEPERLLPEDR